MQTCCSYRRCLTQNKSTEPLLKAKYSAEYNSAVLSMLRASLCDCRYSHADLLFIEAMSDPKQMH